MTNIYHIDDAWGGYYQATVNGVMYNCRNFEDMEREIKRAKDTGWYNRTGENSS